MTTRREVLLTLASSLVLPRYAFSQEKLRRVAWFGAGNSGAPSPFLSALQAGFRPGSGQFLPQRQFEK